MKILKQLSLVAMVVAMTSWLMPTDAFAQRSRGGSFGGSRSYGRSYSAPRSPSRSFGGSRNNYSRQSQPFGSRGTTRPSSGSYGSQRNTFGGSRLNSSSDYTSRYGVPRKSESQRINTPNGATNYTIHRYGGMGDGFMMGYMMGAIFWYYSMPFHPAYYYSRPYTVANPDGTTSVYPGTFQWGSLFFVLLVVGGGGYILYVWLRNRRRRHLSGGIDMSRS
jgi:hypothetical protein